jgi:hypothetical protein
VSLQLFHATVTGVRHSKLALPFEKQAFVFDEIVGRQIFFPKVVKGPGEFSIGSSSVLFGAVVQTLEHTLFVVGLFPILKQKLFVTRIEILVINN